MKNTINKTASIAMACILSMSPISVFAETNSLNTELTLIETATQIERNEMWIEDLNALKEVIMRTHAKFNDDSTIFLPADLLYTRAERLETERTGRLGSWYELERTQLIRENFINALETLIEDVPNLTDVEIAFRISSVMSKLQDGHIDFADIMPSQILEQRFPLTFKWFGGAGGGLYLIQTVEQFENALNKRLYSINDTPIGHIIDSFGEIAPSENIYFLRDELSSNINVVHLLNYMGLFENQSSTFTFINSDDETETTETIEITLTNEHITNINFNSFLANPSEIDAIQMRSDGDLLPFYEGGINRFYFLEEHNILYIVFKNTLPNINNQAMELLIPIVMEMGIDLNTLVDSIVVNPDFELIDTLTTKLNEALQSIQLEGLIMPPIERSDISPLHWMGGPDISEIANGRELWEIHPALLNVIEQNEINTIIIDARYNGGGDNVPFENLFYALSNAVEEDMFFYVTNRGSFSAATVSARINRAFGATIIGEPSGQNAIFYGTNNTVEAEYRPNIHLMNSGIFFQGTNMLAPLEITGFRETIHEVYTAMIPEFEFYTLRPDILVEHTIDHWVNNIDPVMEHIIEILSNAENSENQRNWWDAEFNFSNVVRRR